MILLQSRCYATINKSQVSIQYTDYIEALRVAADTLVQRFIPAIPEIVTKITLEVQVVSWCRVLSKEMLNIMLIKEYLVKEGETAHNNRYKYTEDGFLTVIVDPATHTSGVRYMVYFLTEGLGNQNTACGMKRVTLISDKAHMHSKLVVLETACELSFKILCV
ncbi:Hypothetical_protein [Hexamita inflata]|uniref:Hypothetical_protein n=1 Tax=Hexamita inflata TaxID=28002 RepID=A0AA86V1Z0_9EUKA|nr:Hypothetical protein HINF_LOCUS65159 [Hexamita inflata]